jgi:hypothetical protein
VYIAFTYAYCPANIVFNAKSLHIYFWTKMSVLAFTTHNDGQICPFRHLKVKLFLSQESLKVVYYSYFHSIMTYGLIFCGNSYYSNTTFRLQKRTIRIIVGIRDRDTCREHLRKLKILPLQSQYILSLSLFVINNKNHLR